jgi:serine/threonine-protein kinase
MSITEQLKVALANRYVVERELGAGGMATVYLAHDVKHDRKVALKVLRPELAAVIGAERFLQEIKVTANLQHSHILPLYDSGAAGSFLYYVMPFVEGETLRTKLDTEKQLGVEDAVALTAAIAGALEHAHRQGVIHRDIKPENILLRDDDPLIADFGIALALSHAGGNRLTETGLSIGTPHYMSPEQAMGDRELDARSDVYSLGAMLYEMLTGDPPYTGSTAQAIVAKVITEKAPPVTVIRDTVPGHVAAAIGKALNKLPADRFTAAAEFADALSKPGLMVTTENGPPAVGVPAPVRTFSARQFTAAAGTAVAAGMVAVALWLWPQATPELSRFAINLPADQPLSANHDGSSIAFSPDGRRFVYTGPDRVLYVREIGQLDARPLPGTENARAPFFSPDGEWVAFESDADLRKVALGGGPPLRITGVGSDFRGGAWTPDDEIIMSPTTTAGETSHRWPHALPTGKSVVFTIYDGNQEEARLAAVRLETGETVRFELRGQRAEYATSGHLVYGTSDGSIVAVPFDPDKLEVTGSPVSLLEGVMVRTSVLAEFSLSPAGHLAYLSGQPPLLSLVLVDRGGGIELLHEDLSNPEAPRASPDGRRVVVTQVDAGHSDVWVFDRRDRTLTRMTFEGNNRYPTWSPDGRLLAYSHLPEGIFERDILTVAADGSGRPDTLYAGTGEQWEVEFMPDGDGMLLRQGGTGTGRDIWLVPGGGRDAEEFLVTEFNERSIALSPDGKWLVYASSEAGRDEVYVRPVPGPGGKRQVSVDGGTEPMWSRDGRELYYRGRDDKLYAVPIQVSPNLSVGQREPLFDDRFAKLLNRTNYDVMPDGRFVMLKGGDDPTNVVVVLNWFEELKERVGQ